MLPMNSDFKSNFIVQAKDPPSRVSFVDCGRTGGKAVKFTVIPGDSDVAGSGAMERCDAYQCSPGTAAPVLMREGEEWWAADSIMFPDAFQQPLWHPYIVFDFHNEDNIKPDAASANFHINFGRTTGNDRALGRLQLERAWGDPAAPTMRHVLIDKFFHRNVWIDFLIHTRLSSQADGFFNVWVNGQLMMADFGPNIYAGRGVYMKLANYRLPMRGLVDDGQVSKPSAVIHDRYAIGPTLESVLR